MLWDIYEIKARNAPIVGVMFRGRLRRFALQQNIDVILENATDIEDCVRFAVVAGFDISLLYEQIARISAGASVEKIFSGLRNPILSKVKCNYEERYEKFDD